MFRSLLCALAAVVIVAGTATTTAHGTAAAPATPDLRIRDWWVVPDAQPAVAGNQVKVGNPYRLCYRVVNFSNVASGSFSVGGGGLGIPFNPTRAHPAGLGPHADAVDCLSYPTTPATGNYVLGVMADFFNQVPEGIYEGNNSRDEAITVVP
jgi:hypothetical protein